MQLSLHQKLENGKAKDKNHISAWNLFSAILNK